MSLTIDTTIKHGRVVGIMVNYGFGMPTRLVADGDVARWCGRLVAHYGGTKALVVLGGDKHTRDELVSAALGSLDRALLERVLFRCGSAGGDGGDDLVDEAVALEPMRAWTLSWRLAMPILLALRASSRVAWRRSMPAKTVLSLMDAFSRRARRLLSWAPVRFPFLPLSRPNCWRASGLLCVSCSVASAPRPNICHKRTGYFWLVKRLTCQNKPVPF